MAQTAKPRKKYPTLQIYVDQELKDKLRNYTKLKYGKYRGISMTVSQAIREFLQRQGF